MNRLSLRSNLVERVADEILIGLGLAGVSPDLDAQNKQVIKNAIGKIVTVMHEEKDKTEDVDDGFIS